MEASALEISGAVLGQSWERFEAMVGWVDSQQAQELTHGGWEARLQAGGRELLGQLTLDRLDLRALRETPLGQVVGASGVHRSHAESGRTRGLATVCGPVTVRCGTYREPGRASLHPAGAVVHLPREKYSHGVRRLAAGESAPGLLR